MGSSVVVCLVLPACLLSTISHTEILRVNTSSWAQTSLVGFLALCFVSMHSAIGYIGAGALGRLTLHDNERGPLPHFLRNRFFGASAIVSQEVAFPKYRLHAHSVSCIVFSAPARLFLSASPDMHLTSAGFDATRRPETDGFTSSRVLY